MIKIDLLGLKRIRQTLQRFTFSNVIYTLERIEVKLNQIQEKETKIMGEMDDLKAAENKLESDVQALINLATGQKTDLATLKQQVSDLQTQIAAGNPINPADVEVIAQKLTAMDANITAVLPPVQ